MDITKLVILSVACIGGFIVTSYQGMARQKGWPLGRAFDLGRSSLIAILGFVSQWGAILISFFVNPWWTSIIVLIIGFLGSMILTNIFKVHSQVLSVIILIPSLILVPLFVFNNSAEITSLEHFIKSIDYANEGTRLINQGEPFEQIDAEVIQEVVQYKKLSLNEAFQVDIKLLDKRLDSFGEHYKKEFIAGLELYIDGFDNNDKEKFLMGQVLDNKWGQWYAENIDRIKSGE